MKNMKNLEQKVEQQQNEIQSLKDCVNHLRNSLQLSDAQVRKKNKKNKKLLIFFLKFSEFGSSGSSEEDDQS